jgi:hypothetical protein
MSQSVTQRALRQGTRRAVDRAPAGPDYGPVIRLNRGDVLRTEGPCPDDPRATVRRGRAICQYDRLHARGGLTDAEREAADLYAVLLEQESGARDRPVVKAGGRTPPWLQGHPGEMQVIASTKLRKAHDAIGHHARALLRRFVGDNQPVVVIAAQMKMDERQCMGRVRGALTRLAELWGME